MIKKIFKGIINGEEFDSVEAYNAKVDELVKDGKCFSASTATKLEFVDEAEPVSESKCEQCPCTDEHECERCDTEDVNNTVDNIKKFLDELTGDRTNDEEVLCSLIDLGEDTLEDLKSSLIWLNKEKLLDLLFGLKGEWDAISKLKSENEQCLKALTEKGRDIHRDIDAYGDIYAEAKRSCEKDIAELDKDIKSCDEQIKAIQQEKAELIERKCDIMAHMEDIKALYNDGMSDYGRQMGDNNTSIAVTNSAKSIFDYLGGLYNNLMKTVQEKLKEDDETVC